MTVLLVTTALFDETIKEYVIIEGKHYESYIRPFTHAEYTLYKNSAIALAEDSLET
jgi:hypothetical protein